MNLAFAWQASCRSPGHSSRTSLLDAPGPSAVPCRPAPGEGSLANGSV